MDEYARRTPSRLWGISQETISDFGKIIGLAFVYFVTGKLGLQFAFLNQSASAVWPPTGIALAAVLLLGYRVWPGVWLGAFLVNITTAGTLATTVCIAGGNTVEVVLGAWFVHRFANGWRVFERPQHVAYFALLAAGLSTMISATVGVTSLALAGYAPWDNYAAIWMTWWLGDAVSALAITPLILIWSIPPLSPMERRRYSEAALALTLVFGISLLGFTGPTDASSSQFPRFLVYPASLWAAYRFRQRGAVSVLFVVSSVAIWGTFHGLGPFVSSDPNKSLLLLQTWMGSYALTMLVLGTVVSERDRAEDNLLAEKYLSDAMVNSLPGIFYLIDETGQSFVRWNWNLEKVSGYSSSEIASMNPLEFFEGADKELIRGRIEEVFVKGQADAEAHLVSKEGMKTPFYFVGRRFTTATTRYLAGLGVDITERKRAEAELQAWQRELESRVEKRTHELVLAHKELQTQVEERKRLESEIARAIEREQLRLGQELHDGLGQQLAGIGYMMNALQTKLEKAAVPAAKDAEKVEKLILSSVERVRHLAKGFYPVELERNGLLSALEEVARTTEQIFGVRCVLEGDGYTDGDFKDKSAIQLFRIAQEAVHNAVKHAKAKQIIIHLAAVNGESVLSVADDGVGLSSGMVNGPNGMGLRIMQYRARMLGGTLDVRNGLNGGVIITCSLPAEKKRASSHLFTECASS